MQNCIVTTSKSGSDRTCEGTRTERGFWGGGQRNDCECRPSLTLDLQPETLCFRQTHRETVQSVEACIELGGSEVLPPLPRLFDRHLCDIHSHILPQACLLPFLQVPALAAAQIEDLEWRPPTPLRLCVRVGVLLRIVPRVLCNQDALDPVVEGFETDDGGVDALFA